MAANNMIKVIENMRDEIQETVKDLKINKAASTPNSNSKNEPKTEKKKIFEIDPQSQMNPLALVNQLFSPEIKVEEVSIFIRLSENSIIELRWLLVLVPVCESLNIDSTFLVIALTHF